MVYWSKEMLAGINTGGLLKMTHITPVTIPAENYMLGLLILELVTARRLTEVTLSSVSLQPHIITTTLKNSQGVCPLLTTVASQLLEVEFKRGTAAAAADQLRPYVLDHKMHSYYHGQGAQQGALLESKVNRDFDPFEDDDDD